MSDFQPLFASDSENTEFVPLQFGDSTGGFEAMDFTVSDEELLKAPLYCPPSKRSKGRVTANIPAPSKFF